MDKLIKCKDCGKTFEFTEREQEFYKEHNFIAPKRCKNCRKIRKENKENGNK